MSSIVYNEDCVQGMKRFPDKHFDLAIVDPPYGIGDFAQSDRSNFKGQIKWNDAIPEQEYFKELLRVSKNQIIWGANYYNCFDSGGVIVWDKINLHPSMSRCEIASCSMQKRVTYFQYEWHGYIPKRENIITIHPCQKPVALYDWILSIYAKAGNLILDTHLGSGSSRIACEKAGLDFTGFELDQDYYEAQEKRFKDHLKQPRLFEHFELKSEINELPLDNAE